MNNHRKADYAAALLLEKIVRDTYSVRDSGYIQPLQWSILRYLGSGPVHRCTMTNVRSFLGLTHAPVVRAINTLVKRGLVEQRTNPSDARSKLLALTNAGSETVRTDPMRRVAKLIASLPDSDREKFQLVIRELVMKREMQAARDD